MRAQHCYRTCFMVFPLVNNSWLRNECLNSSILNFEAERTLIPGLVLEKLLFWGFPLSWSSGMETKLQMCMNHYQHKSGWKGPKEERAERLCQSWWFLRMLLSPTPCGNVLTLIKWSHDGISNLSSPDTFDVWICHEVLPCVKGQAGLRYHRARVLLYGQAGRQES